MKKEWSKPYATVPFFLSDWSILSAEARLREDMSSADSKGKQARVNKAAVI